VLLLNCLALLGAEIRAELALDVGDSLVEETQEIERVLLIARVGGRVGAAGHWPLLPRLAGLLTHDLLLRLRTLRVTGDLLWRLAACHLLLLLLLLLAHLRRALEAHLLLLVGLLRLLLLALLLHLLLRLGGRLLLLLTRLEEWLRAHGGRGLRSARTDLLEAGHHLGLSLHLGRPLQSIGEILTVGHRHVDHGLARLQRPCTGILILSGLLLGLHGLLAGDQLA
jgi:hypothetical protein